MRARVVSLRDIHEKYKAEVKRFAPAFVIPRHAPGWDTLEGAEAGSFVYRTVGPDGTSRPEPAAETPSMPSSTPLPPSPPSLAPRPNAIEIRRRA